MIFLEQGSFYITDLGSCNGTCLRLSGERQESSWHPIMDGDVVGAGCTKIRCKLRTPESREAPPLNKPLRDCAVDVLSTMMGLAALALMVAAASSAECVEQEVSTLMQRKEQPDLLEDPAETEEEEEPMELAEADPTLSEEAAEDFAVDSDEDDDELAVMTMARKGPLSRLVVASLALAFSSSKLLCFHACRTPSTCSTELTGRPAEVAIPKSPKAWRRALPHDAVPVRQFLHLHRYLQLWRVHWIGPENLDRAGLRVTGMDTYAIVASVLLQVITGFHSSVEEPDETDERLKYPNLHRLMYEGQMIFASISVVCSTYTMVMFLLCKIYSVMALGLYKDVSYDLFQAATGRFRLRAFWSLIIAMHSFLVAFAMNLFTRIKGNRGLMFFFVGMLGIIPVVYDWQIIYQIAEKYTTSSHSSWSRWRGRVALQDSMDVEGRGGTRCEWCNIRFLGAEEACIGLLAIAQLVPVAVCEVLSVRTSPPRDLEASLANWNLGLDDAGAPPLAGQLRVSGCGSPAEDLNGALVRRPGRLRGGGGARHVSSARQNSRSPPHGLRAPRTAAPREARVAVRGPSGPSVYVVGGHASGKTLDAFQRFDAARHSWELLPNTLTARHGCSACATNGVVYVLGGADDRAVPLAEAERFDPQLGVWEPLPPMPTARHAAACCAVAGVVYALGGFDGQSVLGSVERYEPTRGGWETLPELPTPRGRLAAAGCEGLVFVAGGSDDQLEVSAFEELNPSTWEWQARPPLPRPRGGLALAALSDALVALGGRRTNGEKMDAVERYSLRHMTWESLAPLSSPRDGCCACGVLGKVYVFGGRGMGSAGNQTLALADAWRLGSARNDCFWAGALGAVFVHYDEGLAGLALGDAEVPSIRAVVIERSPGLELLSLLASQAVEAELKLGKLISEDAYEEQFIFRVDEFHATRKENFLWHQYPSLLPSSGRETLSARLMPRLAVPEGWFSRPMGFVPLFNPSLLSLQDGTFLVALRMQGCPSVRAARESSMDTRICRNELVLAHLGEDLAVRSHVLVEMPMLRCRFTAESQTAGRQFLDEVYGPMDARIAWGDEEIWVLFYAERNVCEVEVERGMHAAPLHIDWATCNGWYLYATDAASRRSSVLMVAALSAQQSGRDWCVANRVLMEASPARQHESQWGSNIVCLVLTQGHLKLLR
eukprot:g16440.t1